MTQDQYESVEELLLLKNCRVKEEGKKTAEFFGAGKTVKVSGSDKMQLLSTKMAERIKVKKTV